MTTELTTIKRVEANLKRLLLEVKRLGDEAKAWREDEDNRILQSNTVHHIEVKDASGAYHNIITHSNDPKLIGKLRHQVKHDISPWNNEMRDSPATQEDIRLSDELTRLLSEITPDIPIISEENSPEVNEQIRSETNTYWVIDPIDGTSNFIDPSKKHYGILVGLVENGKPSFGLTYYPEFDRLNYTFEGKAWQKKGGKIEELRIRPQGAGGEAAGYWVQQTGAFKGKLRVSRSVDKALHGKSVRAVEGDAALKRTLSERAIRTDYSMTFPETDGDSNRVIDTADFPDDMGLLEGNLDLAAFNYAGFEWDIAGRQAIIEAAGGKLVDKETGEAPVYGTREDLFIEPVWAAHEEVLAGLRLLADAPVRAPSGVAMR